MSQNPRSQKGLFICLASAVLLVSALAAKDVIDPPFCSGTFSRKTWRTSSPDERGEMVGDLLSNYLAEDITDSETVEMLGMPDSEWGGRNGMRPESKYFIGNRHWLGGDDNYLVLTFDIDGKLKGTGIESY